MSTPQDAVVVVGAGGTPLVAALWSAGYRDLVAVDLAPAALERLKASLPSGHGVDLVVADVRSLELPRRMGVWHDRAVFHFLVDGSDRSAYVERAAAAVHPGGHVVIGAFALDGPEACSGLPVCRYDARALAAEFAPAFDLVDALDSTHRTPWGNEQRFVHVLLRRVPEE